VKYSFVSIGLSSILGIIILLTGCATSDLTEPDYSQGKATLELYPMATSDASTRCMVTMIDGQDVSGRQSWRLTTKYLIPAGRHIYEIVCEDSVGSIAIRGYSFSIEFSTVAGGRYGLLRQQRRDGVCIVVQDLVSDPKAVSLLATHCLS
jgi:hypothetical protein